MQHDNCSCVLVLMNIFKGKSDVSNDNIATVRETKKLIHFCQKIDNNCTFLKLANPVYKLEIGKTLQLQQTI